MIDKRLLVLDLIFICIGVIVNAQDLNFNEAIRKLIENGGQADTIRHELKVFGPDVTYRDTVIVNLLFMPPVFKPGKVLPEKELVLYKKPDYYTADNGTTLLFKPVKIFEKEKFNLRIQEMAYLHLQRYLPSVFRYSIDQLPSEKISVIDNKEEIRITVENKNVNVAEYTPPITFLPNRKYWISSLESSVKFSENSTSDNWHSGATRTTILNIFTKNIVKYNYAKDRIKLDNDIELRLNFYNAPNDTLRQ